MFDLNDELHFYNLKTEKGFSLVELVLVLGVSAIAFFGTTTFFIHNAQEQKKIQAKLANIDFKRSILNTMLSQTANNIPCFSELINGTSTSVFNADYIDTPKTPTISLRQLSSNPNQPPIIQINEKTSSYSDVYKVQSISVNHFKKTNHPELYTANLEIIIVNSKDKTSKTTTFPLTIRTEKTNTNLKKIESCMI